MTKRPKLRRLPLNVICREHDLLIPIGRLACRYCDREDCDAVWELPDDWTDIEEFQTFEESQVAGFGSCGEWWTHLGTCPECDAVVNKGKTDG